MCDKNGFWHDTQVRMQAEGKLKEGAQKKYPNAVKAYGIIARCVAGHAGCSCKAPLKPIQYAALEVVPLLCFSNAQVDQITYVLLLLHT